MSNRTSIAGSIVAIRGKCCISRHSVDFFQFIIYFSRRLIPNHELPKHSRTTCVICEATTVSLGPFLIMREHFTETETKNIFVLCFRRNPNMDPYHAIGIQCALTSPSCQVVHTCLPTTTTLCNKEYAHLLFYGTSTREIGV
jgi:hypothetical protein